MKTLFVLFGILILGNQARAAATPLLECDVTNGDAGDRLQVDLDHTTLTLIQASGTKKVVIGPHLLNGYGLDISQCDPHISYNGDALSPIYSFDFRCPAFSADGTRYNDTYGNLLIGKFKPNAGGYAGFTETDTSTWITNFELIHCTQQLPSELMANRTFADEARIYTCTAGIHVGTHLANYFGADSSILQAAQSSALKECQSQSAFSSSCDVTDCWSTLSDGSDRQPEPVGN